MAREPELHTIGEKIGWSYANLACAHSALKAGRQKHATVDWIVRARLFKGLQDGTMQIGSLFDDERLQLTETPMCVYCGATDQLSADHLIPRAIGGTHAQHNLVRACRSCNSSKGKRDLLAWCERQQVFPRVLLLRRYLKLVALFCMESDLLGRPLADGPALDLPFDLQRLPTRYPPLATLRL